MWDETVLGFTLKESHTYFISIYETKHFQTRWKDVWEVFQNNSGIGEETNEIEINNMVVYGVTISPHGVSWLFI